MRIATLLFMLSLSPLAYGQDCTVYNKPKSTILANNADNSGHEGTFGEHSSSITMEQSCVYSNPESGNTCVSTCTVDSPQPPAFREDFRSGGSLPHAHGIAADFKAGKAKNGSCAGLVVVAATTDGNPPVFLITGLPTGLNYNVTTLSSGAKVWAPPATPVLGKTDSAEAYSYVSQPCPEEQVPEPPPPPPPPCDPMGNPNCFPLEPPLDCSTDVFIDGFTSPKNCSPVIIDTEGEGFHLTDAAHGVTFDIRGNGHPIKLAWTAPGFHNAFLALDRDGTGTITSGKELFGNFTAQPSSANPNGFLALAEFDKPENGGNGDGMIDDHDAVYGKLRLWIDENHDGVAQPNELHTLPELGVFSLALNYHDSRKEDQYGNQFRFRARVNPRGHDKRDEVRRDDSSEVGRNAYDVFFVSH